MKKRLLIHVCQERDLVELTDEKIKAVGCFVHSVHSLYQFPQDFLLLLEKGSRLLVLFDQQSPVKKLQKAGL